MASSRLGFGRILLIACLILVLMPGQAAAFGAGNIPSIAQVEGVNWRHGDIEDTLKTLAFLHGKKWTTLLTQRVYFGNWLRDYSQAIDVGSLGRVNAETIRVLVWVLSFMANGYATEEFSVTAERLGTYRPEEHIDNPLGYADGKDAREFDKRLRGPVMPVETEIDPRTGMKNYIASETGNWATSAGYVRFSLARCIHYGRLYTSGSNRKGNEDDLCEALRCLGQTLHCLEDFSAHSNYCELALRELGFHEVYPHCGTQSEIHLNGRRVFPLVTGTFGGVDFLHSVLGEANDHFTQSEVDEMNSALISAQQATGITRGGGERGLGGRGVTGDFISLISQLPGIGGGFASEARDLQNMASDQERQYESSRSTRAGNQNLVPGMSESFDPVRVSGQIYPIFKFRDRIVKSINRGIAKIPGLENLLEHISETLTAFVLGLLAPFIRPIIDQVSKALKEGSSGVIASSAQSQLEPWRSPRCTDPTHSMLSKDHFTNILNPCAGRIAAAVLKYAVPRILYAWEHASIPVEEVADDILRAFHHPAARNSHVEIQREMFETVRRWADEYPRRHELNHLLGSESVKTGKNHINMSSNKGHSHGGGIFDRGVGGLSEQLGHGRPSNSLWGQIATRDLDAMGAGSMGGGVGYMGASAPQPPQSPTNQPLSSPGYGYHQNQHGQHHHQQSTHSRPTTGGEADSYWNPESSGNGNLRPDPYGYGAPRPSQGYSGPSPQYGGGWGQPSPPNQYGGPPPPQGQWGQPQGYGGGYGGGPPPPQPGPYEPPGQWGGGGYGS